MDIVDLLLELFYLCSAYAQIVFYLFKPVFEASVTLLLEVYILH